MSGRFGVVSCLHSTLTTSKRGVDLVASFCLCQRRSCAAGFVRLRLARQLIQCKATPALSTSLMGALYLSGVLDHRYSFGGSCELQLASQLDAVVGMPVIVPGRCAACQKIGLDKCACEAI